MFTGEAKPDIFLFNWMEEGLLIRLREKKQTGVGIGTELAYAEDVGCHTAIWRQAIVL
jgi:hypothetical protein